MKLREIFRGSEGKVEAPRRLPAAVLAAMFAAASAVGVPGCADGECEGRPPLGWSTDPDCNDFGDDDDSAADDDDSAEETA